MGSPFIEDPDDPARCYAHPPPGDCRNCPNPEVCEALCSEPAPSCYVGKTELLCEQCPNLEACYLRSELRVTRDMSTQEYYAYMRQRRLEEER